MCALQMEYQTTAFGSFTAVDFTAQRIGQMKLTISYQHPARLSWVHQKPQHTFPLGIRNFVRLWDDAANGPDGNPQSSSNPIFEGFIMEVNPGNESNEVEYVAYDPTRFAAQQFNISSLAWSAGTVPSAPPETAAGSYPRLVFNSKIDNDDDAAYQRLDDATVGQMLATIFDDSYHPLYWTNAAPGDGTSAGNGSPYETGDLTVLTFKPQEKEVFESETVRGAVTRLLRHYPSWRFLWYPGTRKWRFGDITASPTVTLTLNDWDADNVVLSLDLQRSLEQRYTAVHFYGPQTTVTTVASLGAGTLTDLSDGPLLQNNIATCCDVPGKNRWQITNSDARQIARMLPNYIEVQTSDLSFVSVKTAQLEGYWPASSQWPAGWRVISGWYIDAKNGIVFLPNGIYAYRYNSRPAPGEPHYENPIDVRFTYGKLENPIQVRYPSSGFEGTAYTVAGIANQLEIYAEDLAVGYEYGQPVTTSTRLAQFQILAEYLHKLHKDIVYVGGCMLDRCRYEFARLDRRVNIAAVDGDGTALTTGWESIGALLTDVEYDFDEQTTTLQFSSDHASLIAMDVEEAKRRLRIRALQRVELINATFQTNIRNRRIGEQDNGFSQLKSVHETTMHVDYQKFWVDPETGEVG